MAIKDIIGPSFVGTSTIKWLVTRGFASGTAPAGPIIPGDMQYSIDAQSMEYSIAEQRTQFKIDSQSMEYEI